MKLLHVSDTHSQWPRLLDRDSVDVIVHSGDMMVNVAPGHPAREEREQLNWMAEQLPRFKTWIGDKPFLFCQGNHDYAGLGHFFAVEGLNAFDITMACRKVGDLWFVGFPYVPFIGNIWNNELTPPQMGEALDHVEQFQDQGMLDVLVAHCPPHGVADATNYGQRIGNRQLADRLLNRRIRPRLILSGHVHECGGEVDCQNVRNEAGGNDYIMVYNNARSQRIIEIAGRKEAATV